MDIDLPYLLTPKTFPKLLEKLQAAAVPTKMTANVLKKFGFPSSNDRAFIGLLKRLGMLDDYGKPTDRYAQFRNKSRSRGVLADGIRDAYGELLDVHTNLYDESLEEIKSAVSTVSGRDQKYVNLIANTFKLLCENADFDSALQPETVVDDDVELAGDTVAEVRTNGDAPKQTDALQGLSFNYNIEIHLPATTDISVYNAIFRSLRDTLGKGK